MSMSKYIRAIPNAEKRKNAIQAIENLQALGLEISDKLYEIRDEFIQIKQREFTNDYEEIIEIDVKDIPKEVEKIQFVLSY